MGVSCNAYLLPDADAHNVGKVLSLLLGAHPVKTEYQGTYWYDVEPKFKEIPSSDDIGTGRLEINTELAKKYNVYPFISLGSTHINKKGVYTYISFGSTPIKIKLANALAYWFGGFVVANDCNDDITYKSIRHCPVDRRGLIPEDSVAWDNYQDSLLEIVPITVKSINKGIEFAGYKIDE